MHQHANFSNKLQQWHMDVRITDSNTTGDVTRGTLNLMNKAPNQSKGNELEDLHTAHRAQRPRSRQPLHIRNKNLTAGERGRLTFPGYAVKHVQGGDRPNVRKDK